MTFSSLTHALPTGHGDSIVVQNFVGDVDASRNALPDGQDTAVKIGAIANVGKHMFFVAEMLLPNPWCAFTTHLRKAHGAAVHPDTHEVTTNTGHGT